MFENMTFEQAKELLQLAADARRPLPDRMKAVNALAESNIAAPQDTIDPEQAKKAFDSFLRRGTLSAVEKATLVTGTDANGGFAVPTAYSNEIIRALTETSVMRRAGARILPITGTDSFKVPGLTDSAEATIGGEGSLYTQSEPTMSEIEFNPFKAKKLSKATEEMLLDSRFDVWNIILQPDYQQAFDGAENTYFTTGTGAAQPQGVVTGASLGVTLATGQTTTISSFDSIWDLFFSLDRKYRANAKWMMNDLTLQIIRKMKDAEGRYLTMESVNGEPTPILLGRPVEINPKMPSPAANADTILFGDFSYYWIADFDGGQLFVQRLLELYSETGHVGFRGFKRFDANVMLPAAIKRLRQSAT